MAGIQLSGLASGFDWKTTVTQLMSIERVPQDNLKKQQAAALKLQSAYDTLKTNLTALKTAASALSTTFTGSPRSVSVSSGDGGKTSASDATASTSSGAALGTYTVNVKSLPKASSGLGSAKLFPSTSTAQGLTLKDYGVTEGTVTLNGKQYVIETADLAKTISGIFATGGGNNVISLKPNGGSSYEDVSGVTSSFGANGALKLVGASASLGGPGDTSNFLKALGLNYKTDTLSLVNPADTASTTFTVSNAGLVAGQEISASWLPNGTTISSVVANGSNWDVTVSSNPTAAGTSATAYSYSQTIPQTVLAAKLTVGDLYAASYPSTAYASNELKINGVSVGMITSGTTLGQVASWINSASGAGVTATIDSSTGKLRLTANSNGDYAISVGSGQAADALGLDTFAASLVKGSGTTFTVAVDGGSPSAEYTSSTSQIDLSLYGYGDTKITPATTGVFSVSVAANASENKTKINALISAYNSLKQMVDDSTRVTTGVDGKVTASVFSNRADINSLLSTIRSRVYTAVEGTGISTQYDTMGKIGIGFDKTGSMSVVDSAKLDSALANNPSAVNALLNSGSSSTTLTVLYPFDSQTVVVSNSGLKAGQSVSASWLPSNTKVVKSDPYNGAYKVKLDKGFTPLGYTPVAGDTATYTPALANQGVATRLVNLVTALTGTGGLVSAAKNSITTQNKRLQNQIDAMDRSLAQQQAALEASFIAMERAQSKYNSMSSQISSAFSSSK